MTTSLAAMAMTLCREVQAMTTSLAMQAMIHLTAGQAMTASLAGQEMTSSSLAEAADRTASMPMMQQQESLMQCNLHQTYCLLTLQ